MSINNLPQCHQGDQFQGEGQVNPSKKAKMVNKEGLNAESDSMELCLETKRTDQLFRQTRDLIGNENQALRGFRRACQENDAARIRTFVDEREGHLIRLDFYINALEKVKEETAEASYLRNSLMKTKERLESIQVPEEIKPKDMLEQPDEIEQMITDLCDLVFAVDEADPEGNLLDEILHDTGK